MKTEKMSHDHWNDCHRQHLNWMYWVWFALNLWKLRVNMPLDIQRTWQHQREKKQSKTRGPNNAKWQMILKQARKRKKIQIKSNWNVHLCELPFVNRSNEYRIENSDGERKWPVENGCYFNRTHWNDNAVIKMIYILLTCER